MIAIAGAKGGCGKTTTTLGLAAAFARSGVESLAVDADRQLPDLHVVAGVEREPTVAALDRDTSWHTLAQESAGTAGAHVLPGKKPTETVELDAALEWLTAGATEVLIDCPSGAGPDVVEAISLADGVVVVTTGSEQSLDAAATTIDIARRLDVPVAGAVFTHCSAVPEAFHSRFDVPVLAVVPESDSPLADDEARTEYERAAEDLAAVTARRPPEPERADHEPPARVHDDGAHSTGAHATDTTASGDGTPSAPSDPASDASTRPSAEDDSVAGDRADEWDWQTENESSHTRRQEANGGDRTEADGGGGAPDHRGDATGEAPQTTDRSTNAARPDGESDRPALDAMDVDLGGLPPGSLAVVEATPASQSEQLLYGLTASRGTLYVSTVRTERAIRAALDAAPVPVGSPTVRHVTADHLSEVADLLDQLPDGSNVVIDTMAPLERTDSDDYRAFLNDVKAQLLDSDSIAVLHCLSRPTAPEHRATTKHVADAVFDVEPTGTGSDRVSIPKFRAADATPRSVERVLSAERHTGHPHGSAETTTRRQAATARTTESRSNRGAENDGAIQPIDSEDDP